MLLSVHLFIYMFTCLFSGQYVYNVLKIEKCVKLVKTVNIYKISTNKMQNKLLT